MEHLLIRRGGDPISERELDRKAKGFVELGSNSLGARALAASCSAILSGEALDLEDLLGRAEGVLLSRGEGECVDFARAALGILERGAGRLAALDWHTAATAAGALNSAMSIPGVQARIAARGCSMELDSHVPIPAAACGRRASRL